MPEADGTVTGELGMMLWLVSQVCASGERPLKERDPVDRKIGSGRNSLQLVLPGCCQPHTRNQPSLWPVLHVPAHPQNGSSTRQHLHNVQGATGMGFRELGQEQV